VKPNLTSKPLALIIYDAHDPVLTGVRIGNAIWRAVNGPPLNERVVPEPLPCSRTLTGIRGGRS